MKNICRVAFLTIITLVLLAVSVSATVTVEYGYEDLGDDVIAITATLKDTKAFDENGGFRAYKNTVNFDSSIVKPFDYNDTASVEVDVLTASSEDYWKYLDTAFIKKQGKNNIYADLATGSPVWTDNNGRYTLDMETYTTDYFEADNDVVMTLYVKLQNGKTVDDLKNGGFAVDCIEYANGKKEDNSDDNHFYGSQTETNDIIVINNFVPVTVDTVNVNYVEKYSEMTTNGIRFFATISASAKEVATEYGFEVANNAEFTGALTSVSAIKSAGVWSEKVYEALDGGAVTYTVVCHGIQDADADKTLYARPYATINGSKVYGNVVSSSLSQAQGN